MTKKWTKNKGLGADGIKNYINVYEMIFISMRLLFIHFWRKLRFSLEMYHSDELSWFELYSYKSVSILFRSLKLSKKSNYSGQMNCKKHLVRSGLHVLLEMCNKRESHLMIKIIIKIIIIKPKYNALMVWSRPNNKQCTLLECRTVLHIDWLVRQCNSKIIAFEYCFRISNLFE